MTSSTTAGRKETERTKLIQEKCQTLLTQMLRDEDNKYCVDCDAKGPRWASWNLGVFLCIRCAGIHRNLGVHISRVKSVNLDTWTPEQVISLQQMGNSRARAVYEAQLPDGFRRPQTDSALESFIRAKYEHKKYLAREWVPPSPPKVDWAKEIDEELERQKRKKKAAQAGAAIGLGVLSSGSGNAAESKKSNTSNTSSSTNAKSGISLPAPLSKPKSSQQQNSLTGSSPKNQRISNTTSSTTIADAANQSNDLLGLTSPTKGLQTTNSNNVSGSSAANDFAPHDSFSGFLSAPSAVPSQQQQSQMDVLNGSAANAQANSLAQEEEDFFNQGSLTGNGSGGGEKDASGKLTKDSILALYGSAPKQPTNPHMNFAGQAASVGNAYGAYGGGNFMNASPAQHQFMTPPNSTSLYNTPVMTAPAAFSAPGMSAGVGGMQQMGGGGLNFATQFPVQGMATNFGGMSAGAAPSMMNMNGAGGGGLVGSGNPLMTTATMAANMNLMQTNQSLISGLALPTMQQQPQQQQQTMPLAAQMGGMMNSFPTSAMGMNMNNMGMGVGMGMGGMGMTNSPANVFQTTPNANSTSTNPQLNQQFGNLNIGNVWQ